LRPLAIAIVIGFGLVLMSMAAENTAYVQWIIPSQTKDAYKQQQHIEYNNQTKTLTAATTTIIHKFIKPVPEK
jgi:signal transduction protein with GAF and PtsI domain